MANLEHLLSQIHVSESTLGKDLKKCSSWLRDNQLSLKRRNSELSISGDENLKRFAFASYYKEASICSGHDVISLLSADFVALDTIMESLDSFIKAMNLPLMDDDYSNLLIYILASLNRDEPDDFNADFITDERIAFFADRLLRHLSMNGISICQAKALYIATHLDVIFQKSVVYIQFKRSLHEIVDALVKDAANKPADEELIESLSEISFILIHGKSRRPDEPITCRELEKYYPKALNLAIQYCNEMNLQYSMIFDGRVLPKIGLCFAAYFERIGRIQEKIRICIICSTGIAGSQLLSAKIKRMYPHIEILGTFPKHRLNDAIGKNPDAIISTIEVKTNIDVAVINNILNNDEFDRIIPLLKKNNPGKSLFAEMISEQLFFPELDMQTPKEAIDFLSNILQKKENAGNDFSERVFQREKLGSTAIGNLVAIPHAVPGVTNKNRICIGILKNTIQWDKEKVQVVFLLQLDDQSSRLDALFDYIYTLVSDIGFIKRLIQEKKISLLLK